MEVLNLTAHVEDKYDSAYGTRYTLIIECNGNEIARKDLGQYNPESYGRNDTAYEAGEFLRELLTPRPVVQCFHDARLA